MVDQNTFLVEGRYVSASESRKLRGLDCKECKAEDKAEAEPGEPAAKNEPEEVMPDIPSVEPEGLSYAEMLAKAKALGHKIKGHLKKKELIKLLK